MKEEEGDEQNLMSTNPAIMVCMCEREIEKGERGSEREKERGKEREGGRGGGGKGEGERKIRKGGGLTMSYMTDTTEQLTLMENG